MIRKLEENQNDKILRIESRCKNCSLYLARVISYWVGYNQLCSELNTKLNETFKYYKIKLYINFQIYIYLMITNKIYL